MGQEEQEAKSGRLAGQLFIQIYVFSVLFMKDCLRHCSLLRNTLLQHFLRILPQKSHRKLRNTPFNWMWRETHGLLFIPWPGTCHRHEIKGNKINSIKMQSHSCWNLPSPASTTPMATFPFPSFNLPRPVSPLLPTCPFYTRPPPLPPTPHRLHSTFLPSHPTFCRSPPMLLLHFLPSTETLSHQLHFCLCLSEDTKLQIKVVYFSFFLRNWKTDKINLIPVFDTSSHCELQNLSLEVTTIKPNKSSFLVNLQLFLVGLLSDFSCIKWQNKYELLTTNIVNEKNNLVYAHFLVPIKQYRLQN